jgi:uncharacterized phage protein (TIGR01671 family)
MAKFRSWNEKLKCFIYFEDGYYSYFENGAEKFFLLGTDFNDLMMRDGKHYQFDWQTAEQSTGLFDKNGKEIYVGDKVKWHDYDNFGCCFEYESIVEQEKGGAYITDTPDGTGSYYVWGKSDELEIIGNIHEGENK